MTNNDRKKLILERILKSSEFVNSQKNQKLLTYLINASIEDVIPREFDIASEVFNRDEKFDPSTDTIVRVSMHNLRIKLEKYYANEGKKDKTHIVIDKGHYELKFVENYHAPKEPDNLTKRIHYAIYGILLLVIIFLSAKTILQHNSSDKNSQKLKYRCLWKEVINSERSKLFVIGDEFFFLEGIDSKQSIIRKHDVNSFDDFDQYKKKQSDSIHRQKTPYPYFPRMVVWPLGNILNIFPTGSPIDFKASSKFTSSDMLEDDIIFIGSFRSLYLFNDIIKDLTFNYISTPNYKDLTITSKDTSIHLLFEGEPGIKHTDFCFLRKLPGPSNNTIIMLFSGFYVGASGVTEIITDNEKLKDLENQIQDALGYLPDYYSILFKSFGHSRTEFKTEVLSIEAFDPENIMW